jgi:hypothetical protein
LNGIRRAIVAAQDQSSGSMKPIVGVGGERREGLVIAIPGAKDEISLHPTPAVLAALWARLPIMSRFASKSFHFERRRGDEGLGRPA